VNAPQGQFGRQQSQMAPAAPAATVLIGVGIALGIAGLFPGYVSSASLASNSVNWAPHLIYLAGWAAGGVLIAPGGRRTRIGALLGLGVSLVTLGLFLADAGAVMAGDGTLRAGLVLSLAGWVACTAGSAVALAVRSGAAQRRQPRGEPRRYDTHQVAGLAALLFAGIGAAVAFAPSWDSYTMQAPTLATQYITEGYAFSFPGPMIVGDVAVMVAIVAAAALAALWRPSRHGAALLAGAVIPLAAQAISAFIQLGQPTSSALFGIPAAEGAALGITVSSGLTVAFWVFCLFVVALMLSCAILATTPDAVAVSEAAGAGNPAGAAGAASPAGAADPAGARPYQAPLPVSSSEAPTATSG
jgi:hypothetical protein